MMIPLQVTLIFFWLSITFLFAIIFAGRILKIVGSIAPSRVTKVEGYTICTAWLSVALDVAVSRRPGSCVPPPLMLPVPSGAIGSIALAVWLRPGSLPLLFSQFHLLQVKKPFTLRCTTVCISCALTCWVEKLCLVMDVLLVVD